jgi:hypothetical protein
VLNDLAANAAGEGIARHGDELRRSHRTKSFLGRLLGVQTEDAAYRKGAEGEQLVGKQLAKLGPGWHVLHSIPIGSKGTDIDHLVIGPAGSFSLNTKNHQGGHVTVYADGVVVNRRQTRYLEASRSEARKVSRILERVVGYPVDVTPVVVVIANSFAPKEQPVDVRVVARKRIRQWFEALPKILDVETVEGIYAAARRPETWT